MVEFQEIQRLIELLAAIPPVGVYAIVGVGAALENVFPPVPSDTFVVLGAVMSDRGGLRATSVLLVAWSANVVGAMGVYGLARRRGPDFFKRSWGRRLLKPHQFERVSEFYSRYGLWAIFFSRFLPVLRVVIPTFAGFAHLGVVRTLIPVATASALWYTVMLYAGIFASQNVGWVIDRLGTANGWLLAVAVVVLVSIGWWWYRTRHPDDPDEELRMLEEDLPGSEPE